MLQAIFDCTISIAVELSITLESQWCNRVLKDIFAEA